MATVAGNVKEKLVGFTTEAPVENEARANFMKHSLVDASGERYLDEASFLDIIAPSSQDYVMFPAPCLYRSLTC